MRNETVFFAAALVFFLTPFFSSFAAERDWGEQDRLRVDGVQLVDASGNAVQLRGMSSHGLRWFPEYINYAAIMTTKQHGANLFRLAMYADSNEGGYSESEEDAQVSWQFLTIGLENSLAAGMYAIVDWHLLKDENPLKTVDKAMEFFDKLGSLHPDHPGIIYEICNEPNGETTWENIREYAEKVIPVIRKWSPRAIILVGTPVWSSRILAPLESPLIYDNIMYSHHYYTGSPETLDHHLTLLDSAREAKLPVFISEWGFHRDGEGESTNRECGLAFIEYMRTHNLSWTNWSLCNKDEDYSAIRPDVTKLSGWTETDLTEPGKIIFEAFGKASAH